MSLEKILLGHQLLTAEITYRMPDHPSLVQEFIWQNYDIAPKFPRLTRFLDYWQINIEGKLVKVRIAVRGLISPVDFQYVGIQYGLN